jgi:hypothetical protein
MLTTFKTVTRFVLTLKVALFWKALTLTVLGTLATAGSLLISVTDIPRKGANPLRTTLPVALAPPATLVGVRVIETRLVAALTKEGANPEIAITIVKIVIKKNDRLCLHICSSFDLALERMVSPYSCSIQSSLRPSSVAQSAFIDIAFEATFLESRGVSMEQAIVHVRQYEQS